MGFETEKSTRQGGAQSQAWGFDVEREGIELWWTLALCEGREVKSFKRNSITGFVFSWTVFGSDSSQ